MMKLSIEQVEHIARLARLGISAEEKETLRGQLSDILDNMGVLEEVDTTHVPPTAQPIALQNVLRPDESCPSYPLEDILQNAPRREEGSFRIRAVFEQDAGNSFQQ